LGPHHQHRLGALVLVASAEKAAYVASKHGILGTDQGRCAGERATTRITCNAICPGWVLTPLVEKQIKERAQHEHIVEQAAKKRTPRRKATLTRIRDTEQIGALTVFLCSEAAAQIRGAAISIDGGWTAQ
jgi:3-hydroxybutyrate dehydrogenase